MRYRSRLIECEAMQWWADGATTIRAEQIVSWVNANGGEARYEACQKHADSVACKGTPFIAIYTINGWVYAVPGHYVVMGDEWVARAEEYGMCAGATTVHEFTVCDPETFEKRWEVSNE